MNRQTIGYFLTLTALIALLCFYSLALFLSHGSLGRRLLGASLTIIPLLYLMPSTILKNDRSYVALAIISPIYLFWGGVIFLWGGGGQGLWVCFWAIILQIGTVLFAYKRKKRKD